MKKIALLSLMLLLVSFVAFSQEHLQDTDKYEDLLSRIQLPEGFKIEIYAANIVDARSLARTEDGKTVFVGNRRRKNVYALTDTDGDMKADRVDTIATGLNIPPH